MTQADADHSPRRHGFNLRLIHVGFAVDKEAMERGFLDVLGFSVVSIIPQVLLLLLLAFTTRLRVLASSFLRFRDHTQ
jgi:hypothetical protein